jgi:hypothetical protein
MLIMRAPVPWVRIAGWGVDRACGYDVAVLESNKKTGLELRDEDVIYREDGQGALWCLRVDDLVVVGEYTNAHGPWRDDWFLIFGYREKGQMLFREIPILSGIEEVLAQLGQRQGGGPIRLQLVNSTQYDSRVLWPGTLSGKPFFKGTGESLQVSREILQLL